MKSIRFALAILILLLGVGTAGYVLVEGWSFQDALWMVAITMATIGYGEVHPLSEEGRLFTLFLILCWFGLGTYAVSMITQAVANGDFTRAIRRRSQERTMRKLKKHYIVVGYGRLGRAVAEELLSAGQQICVIEKDPKVVEELQNDGRIPVIQGMGDEDRHLQLARIHRAKGLAIAVPSPADAVYVSLAARQLNPDLLIVTRIDEVEACNKATRVGADQVVNPYRIGGWRMAHGLLRPKASSFLDLATLSSHAEISMDELVIPAGSHFSGKSLSQLRIGAAHGLLVVAIHKWDGSLTPTPGASEVVEPGDVLIVIGKPDQVASFSEALNVDQT